jgi:hypothetical protein
MLMMSVNPNDMPVSNTSRFHPDVQFQAVDTMSVNMDYSSPAQSQLASMGPMIMGQSTNELKEGIW